MKGGSVRFEVESLSAVRAPDKLASAGICVLSVRYVQKNVLELQIAAKDSEKAFAILRGSCYNIKNIRYFGLAKLRKEAVRALGSAAGLALFLGGILFAQTRVLCMEFVGSGAYYEREVRALLSEEGVREFSAMPRSTGALTARVLALPRVEFCSFKMTGGVLTVEIECAENTQPIADMPLLSPVNGVIEALTVVRGTPLFGVGDTVSAGEAVVAAHTVVAGEARPAAVIAKVTVRYAVSAEYDLSREGAEAQAFLDFGEIGGLHIEKTERGWLVTGVAHATAALNLG